MLKSLFTGECKVFRRDYNGRALYSTSIGSKKQDGTWENAYIGLQFKKGVELQDRTGINIKDAFLTFYKKKTGETVWGIFVMDFEQKESDIPPELATIPEEEIPF